MSWTAAISTLGHAYSRLVVDRFTDTSNRSQVQASYWNFDDLRLFTRFNYLSQHCRMLAPHWRTS